MGNIAAVLILSLSSMLCVASCAGNHESSPETDGAGARVMEIQDDGIRSEPPAGSAGGEQSEEVNGDQTRLPECLALASASVPTKVVFCDTLLPNRGMYARCMSHRFNRLEWINWCYFEF